MDNLYYYTYDVETHTIVPKFIEKGGDDVHPNDMILGMEFFAPEKTFAELCAKEYNSQLVKSIEELETAPEKSIFIEICKDCGRAFAIAKQEYLWFKEKELIPPKRCRACRNKRKTVKKNQNENKENK